TGTVNFKEGAATLGARTLGGTALTGPQATFLTSSLNAGSHSLTAAYQSDGVTLTSTSPVVTQVVNQVTTSTALSPSPNPSTFGQSVTLTATVTGSSPSGT